MFNLRLKKILITIILIFSLCLTTVQTAFADRYWDLHLLAESKKASGDLVGAISAWEQIIDIYGNSITNDALTKCAVYWGNIADAYYKLGWYGEAAQSYKYSEYFWNFLGLTESALGPERTANRISTDLKVYAKTPIGYVTNLAKYEPISGAYFGAPFDLDSQVNNQLIKVRDVYGKTHTGYLMYIRWGEDIQQGTADQAKYLNGILQVSWEPPADMKQIKYSDVSNFAKKLKDLGIPVFLRFACEMNLTSTQWGSTTPTVYKEKFRLIADTMHKEAPNVAVVWAPNYVPVETIDSFYPGDSYVDWVGINGYTDRYFIGDPNSSQLMQDIYYQGYYANPLDRFKYIYDKYSSKKPIFIAETGVQNYSINTNENFEDWAGNNIKRLYGYLPLIYPRIKAIFYFNVDSSLAPGLGLKQNYSLSKSEKVLSSYVQAIQTPYYLSKIGNYNYQYKELKDVTINKNTALELSTYVKLVDPTVSKVDYRIDGIKVGDTKDIPFTSTMLLSTLSEGSHILKVSAYDKNNSLSATRVYKINVSGNNLSFEPGEVQYIPRHIVIKDIDNHWAKDQINRLVGMWSVDGYSDGSFKPEQQITRAEFYKLLSYSLGMNLETNTNAFVDVPYGHWAKQLLDGGAQIGILKVQDYLEYGIGEDMPITRYEMAVWAVRALNGGRDVESAKTKFSDNSQIIDKYRGYINNAVSYGIIDGFEDGTFRPNDTATRAQAVSLIIRAVEYQRR